MEKKLKKVFYTPHEEYSERNGETFTYLGLVTEGIEEEVMGDLHYIKFADGTLIEAWTEEICEIV